MRGELSKTAAWESALFAITNEEERDSIALAVYHFQFHNNPVYGQYCQLVHRTPETVRAASDIPYLPISFFKSHPVSSTTLPPQLYFTSSGTTGTQTSRHAVLKPSLYEQSFLTAFTRFYGPVEDYCILGLLPSYLERGGSSLVYMTDQLIRRSGHPKSGFYLHDLEGLHRVLMELEGAGQKTLLLGVTYALLDFAERYPLSLQHTVVMETGGMKGRKEEMTRAELYTHLQAAFGLKEIHSEYGMTELLSQAYAVNGLFQAPPWMGIRLRDETDPLSVQPPGRATGAINVLDLANLYSCCFIATDDLGRTHPDGRFEVLGRLDSSDIRGCSLLAL
jgi:hypothetical protein